MSKFLLATYTSTTDEPREPMTDEQIQRGFGLVQAVEDEMNASNALLFSGRLLEADQAKVVRPRRRMGKTTDGPFIETKEQIGGFYIVEAPDRETALAWASRVSDAIDNPIEVRPFMDVPAR
ncbi:MAG: YciI family protein [Chloroflexi bacterium]|nr:YciI family protein [Chloroflexota bacterium]